MPRPSLAAALPLALAAAGCSLAPPYKQPEPPIAGEFPAHATHAGDVAPAQLAWRDFFADPQLEVLVAEGLVRNRDLAVAVAQIDRARAEYRIQRAQQLPQLEASGSATRTRQPATILGGPDVPSGASVTFNSYDVAVSIPAFELDFWGRVRNLTQAARYSYLATVEGRRAFQLSLIRDIAQSYASLRETEERIDLAARTVEARREGVEIARVRLDAGVTSTIDFDQSRTLLTQAETELAVLNRTRAETQNFLTVLVGGPVARPLPAPLPLAQQTLERPLKVGLPSDLLVNRPDILQAEAQLRAANANIGVARAAFFPRISLSGTAGFASSELENLLGPDRRAWTYGGLAGLPLLDWGARGAAVAASRAERDAAAAAYQRTVQEAFREVADALAGRRHLAEQIAAQQETVDAQRSLAETARLRYANGITIYLEVLDAERNLFSAEQALIQLRGAALRNEVALYVALGGGWR